MNIVNLVKLATSGSHPAASAPGHPAGLHPAVDMMRVDGRQCELVKHQPAAAGWVLGRLYSQYK